MKFSTVSALIGVVFLVVGLLLIRASASYSGMPVETTGAGTSGQVVIPAAALPPFDPAATRITENEGMLVVYLESGSSRQDLHILPQQTERNLKAVRVFHANHGQLLTLRMDVSCRGAGGESMNGANTNQAASTSQKADSPRCRRIAA